MEGTQPHIHRHRNRNGNPMEQPTMIRDLAFLATQMALAFSLVASIYAITYAFLLVTP